MSDLAKTDALFFDRFELDRPRVEGIVGETPAHPRRAKIQGNMKRSLGS